MLPNVLKVCCHGCIDGLTDHVHPAITGDQQATGDVERKGMFSVVPMAMPLLPRAPGEHRAPGAKITAEQDSIELKKWTAEGKARGEKTRGI